MLDKNTIYCILKENRYYIFFENYILVVKIYFIFVLLKLVENISYIKY